MPPEIEVADLTRRPVHPHDEHERARYGVYALNRRAAEAGALRIHTNTVLTGNDGEGTGHEQAVIVLGDLNDTPHAATTQLLLGPTGSEIGTAGQNQPDQGDPWRLWNLAPLIPEHTRYSRIHRGTGELIDHLLVSKKLLDVVDEVASLVNAADGADLPSITGEPNLRTDAPSSDHAPPSRHLRTVTPDHSRHSAPAGVTPRCHQTTVSTR